jgi:hypothetical protein
LYSKNYYRVDCTSKHVTRAPKQLPSVSPTTVIPTAAPSITGAVTSLSIMSINGVLKNLHINEINQIRKVIIDAFIIKSNDVTMNIKYHSVILLKVNNISDKKKVENNIKDEMKILISRHPQDILISIKNNDITITIESDNYNDALEVKNNMKKLLINQFKNVMVQNIIVQDIIKVSLPAVVDSTDGKRNFEPI